MIFTRDLLLCARRLHLDGGITNSQSFKPPDRSLSFLPSPRSAAVMYIHANISSPTLLNVTILGTIDGTVESVSASKLSIISLQINVPRWWTLILMLYLQYSRRDRLCHISSPQEKIYRNCARLDSIFDRQKDFGISLISTLFIGSATFLT